MYHKLYFQYLTVRKHYPDDVGDISIKELQDRYLLVQYEQLDNYKLNPYVNLKDVEEYKKQMYEDGFNIKELGRDIVDRRLNKAIEEGRL